MPSLGAWEGYPTPHWSAGKCKRQCSPKIVICNYVQHFQFLVFTHVDSQKPPMSKKEQNCCHSGCHNHSHSFQWLLTTINCWLDPYYTYYAIAKERQVTVQVYCVLCCGFVPQKLVQIAANCLYHTSDPLGMFINGA